MSDLLNLKIPILSLSCINSLGLEISEILVMIFDDNEIIFFMIVPLNISQKKT
jgi:hypothetical protein